MTRSFTLTLAVLTALTFTTLVHAADEHNVVEVVNAQLGLRERLLTDLDGALDQVLGQILFLSEEEIEMENEEENTGNREDCRAAGSITPPTSGTNSFVIN